MGGNRRATGEVRTRCLGLTMAALIRMSLDSNDDSDPRAQGCEPASRQAVLSYHSATNHGGRWSLCEESDPGRTAYKAAALPLSYKGIELRARIELAVSAVRRRCTGQHVLPQPVPRTYPAV